MRDAAGNREKEAAVLLKSHIEEWRKQRESLNRLIASLTAILKDMEEKPEAGGGILTALGSPCPHCPDYEEKMRNGSGIIDERARFLAAPLKRPG